MNKLEIEKIRKFLNDDMMVLVVKNMLMSSFLNKSLPGSDVQVLAASRLAIDFLNEGFKEIEKYRHQEQPSENERKQVGM